MSVRFREISGGVSHLCWEEGDLRDMDEGNAEESSSYVRMNSSWLKSIEILEISFSCGYLQTCDIKETDLNISVSLLSECVDMIDVWNEAHTQSSYVRHLLIHYTENQSCFLLWNGYTMSHMVMRNYVTSARAVESEDGIGNIFTQCLVFRRLAYSLFTAIFDLLLKFECWGEDNLVLWS